MPVELAGHTRFFRLAESVSEDGLYLSSDAPPEFSDAKRLAVVFHLPGDPLPIKVHGTFYEVRLGEGDEERSELRGLRFLDLDAAGHTRIMAYVEDWVGRIK